MKVVICGAGQVGYGLADYLCYTGADVVVIDTDPVLIKRITENLEVQGIVGHASLPGVLHSAGLANADLLLAVTAIDEVNIVACQIAHYMFGTPTKIARIREQAYLAPEWAHLFNADHLAIDVAIFPEAEVAQTIRRFLNYPGTFDVIPLLEKKLRLMGIVCTPDCPILYTPMRQLKELFPRLNVFMFLIYRNGRAIFPNDDEQFLPNDEVYFIADYNDLPRVMVAFGHEENKARRILIAGAGRVGIRLAESLSVNKNLSFRLFETSEKNAERAALKLANLNGTVVLGDVLDQTTLLEQNLSDIEAFVAVTNHDETNILGSLLAKQLGAERTICLVNSQSYNTMLPTLGIDSVINPRLITVSSILRLIRRGKLRSVFSLQNKAAEIIEAEINENSRLAWHNLKDGRRLAPGVTIGALIRGAEVFAADIPTKLHPHDHLVLIVEPESLKTVEKMFSNALEYL